MDPDVDNPNDDSAGSDRAFGLVFALVFALVALWPLAFSHPVRAWALGIAALLAIVAFVVPGILRPFKRAWLALGAVMHRFMSPLVLGMAFFGVFLLVGLSMRVAGKRPLQLAFDRNARTYWIARSPPGPDPDSLKNQF